MIKFTPPVKHDFAKALKKVETMHKSKHRDALIKSLRDSLQMEEHLRVQQANNKRLAKIEAERREDF